MTLLEKAKRARTRPPIRGIFSEEEIEVILAWMKGEIMVSQIKSALEEKNGNNFYSRAATCLREAYRKGLIKIVE